MNVWADDPWQDDTVFPQKQEAGTLSSALPRSTAGEAFGDEAGWGNFESSEENAWGNDPWAAPVNDNAPVSSHEHEADLPVDATPKPGRDQDLASDVDDHERSTDQSIRRLEHSSSPIAQQDEDLPEELAIETSFESPDITLPKAQVAEEQPALGPAPSEDPQPKDTVRQHDQEDRRPATSSSEEASSAGSLSILSDRLSLEQGVPDEGQTDIAGEEKQSQHAKEAVEEHEDLSEEESEEEQDGRAGSEDTVVQPARAPLKTKTIERTGPDFKADVALLKNIFKHRANRKRDMTITASEELIDSTSTRKMWYRLSRPQTLRGFLSGDMEDTHVRIAWPTSRVRQETVKIVARWTTEDRASGRTGFSRASKATFGWDEPRSGAQLWVSSNQTSDSKSPATSRFPHSRQPSLVSKAGLPQLSPVASFGWSTSPTTASFPTRLSSEVNGAPNSIRSSTDNPWRRSVNSRPSSSIVRAENLDAVFAAEQMDVRSNMDVPIAKSVTSGYTAAAKKGLAIDVPLASTAVESEDEEWGETVQSPPPPQSPSIALPQLRPVQAAMPQKARAPPSPISPVTSKQDVPDGPLSPARRAAFNAARVTRTLSSKHEVDHSSQADGTADFEDFTKIKLRKTSGPAEVASPSPIEIAAGKDNTLPPRQQSAMLTMQTPFIDDLSLFETMHEDRQQAPTPQNNPKSRPMISAEDAKRAQHFLTQLPDLSYMFR